MYYELLFYHSLTYIEPDSICSDVITYSKLCIFAPIMDMQVVALRMLTSFLLHGLLLSCGMHRCQKLVFLAVSSPAYEMPISNLLSDSRGCAANRCTLLEGLFLGNSHCAVIFFTDLSQTRLMLITNRSAKRCYYTSTLCAHHDLSFWLDQ